MRFYPRPRSSSAGFTLAEVLIAVVVCVLFAVAAYATNERLLLSLKAQRETAAASMMLQERMEKFRARAYSEVANKDFVQSNILTFNPSASPSPTPAFPPGHGKSQGKYATWSEDPLNNLQETVTVSGYQAATSPSPSPSATPSDNYMQWTRDTSSSGDGQPHVQNHDDNLSTQFDLLKVDISITWTSANGRARTRDLSAIFGKGNIGP
jgi:prepilin-type N-terminal cleavage/methylation domain-containing protein